MKKVCGEIISLRGLIATVGLFSEDKPYPKEILVLEEDESVRLEVQRYTDASTVFCIVFRESDNVKKGAQVRRTEKTVQVPVGPDVKGRMLNAFGEPIDGRKSLSSSPQRSVYAPTDPLKKLSLAKEPEILETGIKIIDFLTPFVKGSQIGISGGAGVGKTVIISAIIHNLARSRSAFPMFTGIGERIHEGEEMYRALAESGLLEDTILLMGQMNEKASIRSLVGNTSASLAQYLRDEEEKDVLFFVDNMYRFVQAGDELSTMMGEVPSEGGYQPTIFSDLRRLQERLHSTEAGSITSVQTVYVPADDETDPAVQEIQQQLDSVIVLSRSKAEQNLYPAVDILATRSSMVSPQIIGDRHYNLVTEVQSIIQEYNSLKSIVSIIGEHELSKKDSKVYNKAQELIDFFAQDLYVSGKLTGEDIMYYKKEDVLDDIEAIVNK